MLRASVVFCRRGDRRWPFRVLFPHRVLPRGRSLPKIATASMGIDPTTRGLIGRPRFKGAIAMASLLHLIASPRPESYSTRVANEFTAAYRQTHPADRVEQLDLFRAEIPPFLAPAAKAKYAVMGGQAPKDEAQAAWAGVIKTIVHFKGFDKYVLSAAMWNFGIPYRLKQYIDVIVQPGLSFAYSPEKGYTGLVVGKPLMLVLARGGNFRAGQSLRNLRFPGDLSPRRIRLHRL